MSYTYKQLNAFDVSLFKDLLNLFGEVFEEPETYHNAVPKDDYLVEFLSDNKHIVLIAEGDNARVVGGLVAYELKKFEKVRSEIFVYDLAVSEAHRRKGIATRFFDRLKQIAKERGAYEIFVQAEKGDEGAISLYRTLASGELEAHHFEINIEKSK
jgi:aminoglycoside 3-N-acetyltransferase I